MRLSNKITDTIILMFFTVVATLMFSTCKPAIGTPWYPRSVESFSKNFVITDIQVAEQPVTPVSSEQPIDETDKLKKFSEAREYLVNVAPSIEEILPENIKVNAVSSLSTMEKVEVSVEINGDGAPLVAGKVVPVTIKIKDMQAKYGEVTKVIKITQNEPFDLILKSLTIADENAMSGSVTLPYKKNILSAADIRAEFICGTETPVIPVVLEKNSLELKEDETIDVKISVKALKGQYKDFAHVVSVTRGKRDENEDVALEPLEMYVQGIKSEIGKEVSVPSNVTQITEDDIVVIFKTFDNLPVKLKPNPIKFDGNDSVNAEISVEGKEGKYLDWNMKFTVKRNAAAVYNPVDKNGNKKYVVKINTITEEIDPFTYYDKDYSFPASKFDEWVVYINAFDNGSNIASYKFKPDSWSGLPEQYAGPDFGSGLKHMGNVKFYRYKSRTDRWGGITPPLFDAEKEKRFYFYRFTASGGVDLDNSMFCVDTHSKFLFYYSDPASISSLGVPGGWTDYAAPSSGSHKQFDEPFYLSDPVGYVKEDGLVVLYSWIKQNITNNNYTAQKNPIFTKPAEKKSSGAGFSPYRNKIKKNKTEVIRTENSDYTVARPLILAQPKALRIPLNSTEDAVMTVKAAPVPDGETLSYKWYKNDYQSNEGGTLIDGEVLYTYRPNRTVATDCYIYCEVTNTNSSNGKTDTVKTDAVKLLISSGPLYTDAAQPKIIKEPESKTLPINTSGSISLKVEALSTDMGKVSYQWYKNTSDSNENGTKLNGEISATLNLNVDTASVKTEYYYCVATNTNDKVDGEKTATRNSDVVKVEVEEAYKIFFDREGKGGITAIYDQKVIQTGDYVKKGKKVTFLAQADAGYEVLRWDGVTDIAENKLSASITVTKQETVRVVIRKIPDTRKLTITAKKLENITLCCDHGSGNKNPDHAYFVYNFKAQIFNTAAEYDTDNYQSLWSIYNGEDTTNAFTQVSKIRKLNKGEAITSSNSTMKEFAQLPETQFFRLDTKLVKYDKKWSNTTIDKQYLSGYGQSVVEFVYDKAKDEWTCKKAAIENNFNIPNVTASFDENFVLKRGQTKDFIINYYVDNYSNFAVGAAEVTYTLKWE